MKVYFDSTDVSEYVTDLEYSGELFNDEFYLGATLCNQINMQVIKEFVPDLPEIVRITDDEGNNVLPSFIVDDYKDDNQYYRSIQLADYMLKGNRSYYPTYTNSETTFETILNNIATVLGTTISTEGLSGLTKETSVNDENITCRDYLSYVAERNAGYWRIDQSNQLYFTKYTATPTATISIDDCADFEIAEPIVINRYQHSVGTYPLTGNDETTYIINEDNQMVETEDDVQDIYDQVSELEIYPITVKQCMLPENVKAGDVIAFSDGTNTFNTIAQPELAYNSGWTGGFSFDVKLRSSENEKEQIAIGAKKVQGQIKVLKDYTDLKIETSVSETKEYADNVGTNTIAGINSSLGARIETAESLISQNANAISSKVSTTQLNNALENYVTTSTFTQKSDEIDANFTTVTNKANANQEEIETLKTAIVLDANGITIGKSNSNIKGRFDNDSLDFIDNAGNTLASLDSGDGLIATKLSVGSDTDATKRWNIRTSADGTHLTFTRHS